GGPRTGKPSDRYVPPVSCGIGRGKALYRLVHTDPTADRYTDRPLPGGTAKIDRQRLISAVGGRFRLSAIDFDRQRSIDGEIDHWQSTEEGKGKRRRGQKERSTWPPSSPARCPRKYMAAVLAYTLPTRPRCPRVDRETSPPVGHYRPRAGR
ncbi:hypothetical protein GW17_00037077, partial [Ensete ventricosum]